MKQTTSFRVFTNGGEYHITADKCEFVKEKGRYAHYDLTVGNTVVAFFDARYVKAVIQQ